MFASTSLRALVAIVLLALYVILVVVAILRSSSFSGDMASALAAIAALVSALVVSELAVTQPNDVPTGKSLGAKPADQGSALKWVTVVYIVVWLVVGLVSLLYGWLKADAVVAVATVGKAWLGTAIAAAYVYFGVKPASG